MEIVKSNNHNAPYIREIIDSTSGIGGTRVSAGTLDKARNSVLDILKKQQARNRHVRTKTY